MPPIRRALFGDGDLGPVDADPRITDLTSAFDPARLTGTRAPIPAQDAHISDSLVATLPQQSGYGCRALGIVPTDMQMHIPNMIPVDFNPRPKTNPSPL